MSAHRPIGTRVHRFDEVDSTSEEAFRALERGEGQTGDVFVARRQTGGRGTRGRSWVSPEGGLYLSVILGIRTLAEPAGLWTLAGALAVADLARGASGAAVALDWPNDVVVPGRGEAAKLAAKLAGILAEARGGEPGLAVLGIGVNVRDAAIPEALRRERAVTSLEALGATSLTPEAAAEELIRALDRRCGQAMAHPHGIFDDAFDLSLQGGRGVRLTVGNEVLEGTLVAFDAVRGAAVESGGRRRWVAAAHIRSIQLAEEERG